MINIQSTLISAILLVYFIYCSFHICYLSHFYSLTLASHIFSVILGEEPFSYGYGGTAKFSTDCKFTNYGERFTTGDVITCLVDFQERPPNMSFSKNGRWFGVAQRLNELERGKKEHALFPHILSKNCK